MWYDTTVDPDGSISYGFYDGFAPTDPNHYYFTGVQGSYKQPTTDKIWNGRIDVSREVDLGLKIGRAHVSTPDTNAHLVCRLVLEKKQERHFMYLLSP